MDAYEVIGAFVDHERVDPIDLKAALSTDEGRQYLVDLIALRETAADAFLTAPAATMSARPVSAARSWLRPVASAAAILIALTGGYVAGQRAQHAAPVQNPSATSIDAAHMPAPRPTSIIKLQPGVDWHEQITRN
jgi:hypothetical protein